jgi:hypothetical protein
MILNEANFTLYAAKYYDNPNCLSPEEFMEDLNRIKYLKKLFYGFKNKNSLRERLIINHLVVLYNVFQVKACTKMLFFKLDGYHDCLVPFLMYLGYLPEIVHMDDGTNIETKGIIIDHGVVKALRTLDEERLK